MPPRTLRTTLLLALLCAGCGDCGGKPKAVPFKRNEALPGRDAGTATKQAAPPTVTAYEQPSAEVVIGAARITLPEHRITASVSHDLSGDGTADALLLSTDGEGAIRLHAFLGEPSGGYRAAQAPLLLWQQPGCEAGPPQVKALSSAHLLVRALTRCEPPPPPDGAPAAPATPAKDGDPRRDPYDLPDPEQEELDAPAAPTPSANAADAAEAQSQVWIVTMTRAPRKLEWLRLPADPTLLSATFSGPDADGDGHPDVRMDLAVRLGADDDEAEHLAVTWLDRPSGLGHDASQPEGTLLSLADAARGQLRKDAPRAEQTARRVLALHDRLCQGGAAPILHVGGVAGLPCGRSIALARAVSVRVAALAKQARLIEALATHAQLRDSATQDVRKVDRTRAEAALAEFPGLGGHAITRGPRLQAHRTPPVHAPRLRFDGEARLRVLSPSPASFSLATGTLTPGEGQGDNLLTSPDRRFAVTEVFRSCEGYRLRIVRASQVIAGVEAGPSIAQPLLAEAPPPAGARCPQLSTGMRNDDGGFHVLRWSGGGIVVLRGGAAAVLPTGDDGQPTGPLQSLSQAEPANLARHIPAPLRSHIPIVTKLGIALLDLNRGRAQLLRMDSTSGVSNVAVSPSGKRIAFTREDHLWIAQPAPSAPAPAAKDAGPPAGP